MKIKVDTGFLSTTSVWVLLLGVFLLDIPSASGQSTSGYQTARNGKVFQIFQFPRNQMPRIDGDKNDWAIVPKNYTYGTDQLSDTEDGAGTNIDPRDLDVKVTIGWVKGLNRIYFLYEAYDDFWDFERFNPEGYMNDIFELVVDGDLSGGPFIQNPLYDPGQIKWQPQTPSYIENHLNFSGVHAQNYHIYTPPVNNAWVLVWGCQPWISEFPRANYAYEYDFKHGESGTLVLEGWITPYDYAPYEGPQRAVESELKENKVIGLSWSILDFDGGKREGHVNLAHNTKMVNNASYLCAFQLMPLEKKFLDPIKAAWTFEVIDEEKGIVAFKDESIGTISKWTWDFGNGDSSTEQNPVFQFKKKSVRKVITLTVEGPAGSSKRTRYWEVMIR
jgi:hypothetical protein